jgi:alkyl sulfatase BDS1-like metallo-beta-lactamase superfamily hydrolase
MSPLASADHPLVALCRWNPASPAERIAPEVLMSRSTSNSYLVSTGEGDVVINTGTAYQGPRHRERYEEALGRALRVRAIVLTQSHDDHFGGWHDFAAEDVDTIAHREYLENRDARRLLRDFFAPRSSFLVSRLMADGLAEDAMARLRAAAAREPETITTFVDREHTFTIGGRTFQVLSVPGGETTDALAVWMPAERIAFIGNLDGPIWRQLPHLYTIRGDRQRSARQFIRSIQTIIDLAPELLVTGHGEPVGGTDVVRADLTRLRDGTAWIHDRTVEGMNAGRDLWTLMREIHLPDELQPAVNRGPVRWYVRAIWEEYAGWFRWESPTELYGVPPSAVWSDLAELAGGAEVLAERARRHTAGGRPLEALHLAEIALAADVDCRSAREAELAALEQLLQSAGNDFDELAYLEDGIAEARAALAVRDEAGS